MMNTKVTINMWLAYMAGSILVLGLISDVCMETCPEAEDIYPCECNERHFDTIVVTCDGFETKQLHQAINSLRGKKSVILYLEKFPTSIPWKLFSDIGFEWLQFRFCHVDNLTDDEQPGNLDIEEISFYQNPTIPSKLHLGHLKKLKKISLTDNNITELGDDWLSGDSSSLEELHVWENNFAKIGDNVFSQLYNLKKLYFQGIRKHSIKRSMLPSTANRLEYLSLQNNSLTELPTDLFIGMPAIKEIYLSNNGIETLDQRTWSPIWHQLRRLYLDDNKIICDDRLNWIIKSIRNPQFYGKCSAPKEFEGKSLYTFFQSKSL